MARRFTTLAAWPLAIALPLAAGDVSKGPNRYSIAQEMALGKQLAMEVEKQTAIVTDFAIAEYINRLGQNLARHSDSSFPMTFKMIDSEEVNAFTLPGGYVFVNRGVLELSATEAELSSVIAHELGHAAARHATRQATQNELLNAGKVPLAMATGGLVGLAARQVFGLGSSMAFYHFSRAFESEADLLGVQYLWKAGYDPTASVDMFERVESTERAHPGTVSKLFRTHPLTTDRIEKTQRAIGSMPQARDGFIVNTSEYEAIRERLHSLPKERLTTRQ